MNKILTLAFICRNLLQNTAWYITGYIFPNLMYRNIFCVNSVCIVFFLCWDHFQVVAQFCPHLCSLTLSYCTGLTATAFQSLGLHKRFLQTLNLQYSEVHQEPAQKTFVIENFTTNSIDLYLYKEVQWEQFTLFLQFLQFSK